jgi:hypothetical protein
LSLLCQLLCFGYILVLRFFVASNEQENQKVSVPLEVYAVTRSVIDAQFTDSLADRSYISEVAEREARMRI